MDKYLNKIVEGNCVEVMRQFDDNVIDLTVTSPPYDDLRNYKGFVFPFEDIAKELYRVTKPGGVVVWVVNDATINGNETGTSFKQVLYFREIGFNLHDTMIFKKANPIPQIYRKRYNNEFEFMFVFSKGTVKTHNPLMIDCLHGVVLRVMILSFCLSVFQLFSLTTSWYLPFSPFTYVGTNPNPSIVKFTGLRIPLFSLLIGSFNLFFRNKYMLLPIFRAC